MIRWFLFFGLMSVSVQGVSSEKSMCNWNHSSEEISLMKAFSLLNRALVNRKAVVRADMTFAGCSGETTWGLLEKNNYPSSFDIRIVFMFFKGLKEGDDDKLEFSLNLADDPYLDGVAWVSRRSGEVFFLNMP